MTIKGKKIPNWVIPVVGLSILALYLIKKKSSAAGTSSTEPGTQGLSNQSFIPVTGENVAGVGAGNYGSSGGGEGLSTITDLFTKNQEQTREYLIANKEEAAANRSAEKEWLTGLLSNLGTGGGAPYTPPTSSGVTPAPPPPTAPVTGPAPKAPSGDPVVANVTCGNGCQGHKHKSGKVACQVRNAKHQCVWP